MSNLDREQSEPSIPVSKLRLLRLKVEQIDDSQKKPSGAVLASVLSGVLAASITASATLVTGSISAGVSKLNAESQRRLIDARVNEAIDNAINLRARITPLRNTRVIATEDLGNLERDVKRHVAHIDVALRVVAGFVPQKSTRTESSLVLAQVVNQTESLIGGLALFRDLTQKGAIGPLGNAKSDEATKVSTDLIARIDAVTKSIDALTQILGVVAESAFGQLEAPR